MLISWSGKAYKFDGWHFEVHKFCGPAPLNKNWDVSMRVPGKKFWLMWEKFQKLTDAEKQEYCVWAPPQ